MQPMHANSEGKGRIIPLRRTTELGPDTTDTPSESGPAPTKPRDPVRHYLKFMLPAIPVVTFVMSFLYSYLLVGFNIHSIAPADLSLLPLVVALLIALTTGILCLAIYLGVQHITERER